MVKYPFDRLEEKLDRLDEKLSTAMVTQGRQQAILEAQHASLVEHMKRSDLLEAKLVPVERHVSMVNGALKLVGVIAMLAEAYHYARG